MKLYKYQNTGKDFLKDRRYALLADSMGIGKSCQAIIAAKELSLPKILIICPASVKYTWKNEIEKWLPGTSTYIINSGKDTICSAKYTIINYDLLYSKKIFLQLISRDWDLIVADECHYAKNLRAKRTKCLYYPKGLKDRTDRMWLLSGTPVLNRPVELFSHLKTLIPEKLGVYKSYRRYCDHFCAAYETKFGLDVSGASNIEELAGILDSFMLRRLKKDVLAELPDKTYQNIVFQGNPKLIAKERGEYEKEREGILGELASVRRESAVAKVPFIVSHIKDILEDKRKAVVFAYHRDVISALMEDLRAYSPVALTGSTPANKRQEAVEVFKKDPGCRLFIGQIEAAGTGIDGLQDVCDTVVFAEMTWVPGRLHQAIDRCHRIGQKNPVLVQFLIVEGSIDEDIADAVARKEKVIEKLVKPTQQKETEMSMENELKRIADALERIETKIGAPLKMEKSKPVVKRKGAKIKETTEDSVIVPATVVDEDVPATGAELMSYCNAKLVAVADVPARTAKIKAAVAMFKTNFGVSAIRDIETGEVANAKVAFDTLLEGE